MATNKNKDDSKSTMDADGLRYLQKPAGLTCSPQAVPIRSSKGSAIQENRGHEEEQVH